ELHPTQFGYVLVPLALIAIPLSWRRSQTIYLAILLILITGFWLFFTHLQGRFLILIVPICALLLSQVQARWWTPALAIVLSCGVLATCLHLHQELMIYLYGEPHPGRPAGVVQLLGRENYSS